MLALRVAWNQAGAKTRRKWLQEIVGCVVFSDCKQQNGAGASAIELTVLTYLAQRTVRKAGSRAQANRLLADFNHWASSRGAAHQTPQSFGRSLRRLGTPWIQSHHFFYVGIHLREGGA